MRALFLKPSFLLPAGLALVAGAVMSQTRPVNDLALKNAGKSGTDWISYGLTPGETRYSPLNQINASNVSKLGLAWSYDIGTGGGNQEATPLVWNGTIYSITNWSVVYAVDARTGKEKWRWDPEVNQSAVRPKVCCGIVNRGLALYNGKVIAPVLDGRLDGLDAETGKVVWESRVAFTQDSYTLTMAPRIAKGKVIVGVSGAEYPVRGFFAAYDANTGQFAWKFYTVPGDPSKGFENEAMKKAASTWAGEWWKMGGGATVWDAMSYDPDTNLLYVGTGNAGPWPEQVRGQKADDGHDNLYAASVLAVNPDNGVLKWYFQMVPGDEWDFDSVQQLLLADITVKGQLRKVIMQANKNGFYYVIDRTNGKFISGQPWVQVNWAKGLNEATGRPIVNPEAHYTKDSTAIMPGPGGAHNWSPMSFNPTTGLVYIPSTITGSFNYSADQKFEYKPGRQNMGIASLFGGPGGAARGAASGAAPPKPITPPKIGPEPLEGQRGALIAWDPVTQKQRWIAPGGGSIGGGTVTTAGNLVFNVIPDGRLVVYSADKGEKLLDVQTGLRGGMGPPITYELDGKQYVTVAGGTGAGASGPGGGGGRGGAGGAGAAAATTPAAGAAQNDGIHIQAEATPPPPPPPAPGRGGPAPAMPKMLTFVLDGKMPLPSAEAAKEAAK
ncbi:MAG TPA: PQQ-dependent dehydrogenase, methanol/ethanol family [Bryobacteraceae bacterium]|jgi:PQQ-dependent dehydrogenase (methanol/ethanol family)|nr:PQQ-dependent dehydrogenase, methanol/ethanol family [Bryobacteraceae bacterium]